MLLRNLLLLLMPLFACSQQDKKYKIKCVAFYNVENLFDISNDTLIFDDERTPEGSYRWNEVRYQKKIAHISKVLSEIGRKKTNSAPDIIGLCEIENRDVLLDLIQHPNLSNNDYGVIHFPSPDERGIDVALLYKKHTFLPTSFKSHRLILLDELGNRNYTRDQLVVTGILDDEPVHFLVNHWPSRRGGEQKSRPNRIKAAQLNKQIIDSIQNLDANAKIISMGDFNDDPINDSFKKVLKTEGRKTLDSLKLFNPMEKLYKKGIGSLAYRDKWNLFDQFFMTQNLTQTNNGYFLWNTNIYAPNYLRTSEGKYEGYPFRTYAGMTYQGGYSDHFPIYLYLLKEKKKL
ncbi:MAG: endonuclease/exonuclease/phosphatase family protein [Bacteroidota bacterium]